MSLAIVTGHIGSGKSTFSKLLAGMGAEVLSADDLVHQLYATDVELVESIEALVGKQLRLPGGRFDRAALADAIFQDQSLRTAVEAVVHPAVQTAARQWAAGSKAKVKVYELPLWRPASDRMGASEVVLVTAPADVRKERLISRGMKPHDVEQRLAVEQDPAPVDTVVDNTGDLEALKMAARALFERLQANASGY